MEDIIKKNAGLIRVFAAALSAMILVLSCHDWMEHNECKVVERATECTCHIRPL